jgi:hypothetical protein
MEKTPWRKTVDPNFIGTYVLPNDQPIDVVIIRTEWKMAKVQGQDKKKVLAYFAPNPHFDKPMLLNPTNMDRLERMTGTKYYQDWVNVPVTLQREWDKMPNGTKDWCLRIAKVQPKITSEGKPTKPKLTPESTNWNDIIKWVQSGNDISKVSAKYEVSSEDMVTFKQALEVKPEVAEEAKEKVGEETQSQQTNEQS